MRALALASLLVAGSAAAEDTPAFAPLRYDEDWTFLADASRRSHFLDPAKHIRVGDGYLSLGGEVRERFEAYTNEFFRREADSAYFLQRYLLHADYHATEWLRAFFQLQSSLEDGRDVPRVTDRDSIDVHQLFVDATTGVDAIGDATLRVGRQEMLLGSERLVSVREGTNNRRAFDAVRVLLGGVRWTATAFVASPVEVDHGAFDDRNIHDTQFWGVYATVPFFRVEGLKLDLYYLGFHNADAVFDEGAGNEKRHTLGVRFFGRRGRWEINDEAMLQVGSYDGGDLRAWSVATDHSYELEGVWGGPRLGLKAAIASGDGSAGDGELETFNPLFPRGNYFTEASLVGPQNFFDLHPCLRMKLHERVSFEVGGDFYWRESLDDGIYTPGGALIFAGDASAARYVGTDLSLLTTWQITRRLGVTAAYTHFFAGAFVDESGGADADYWALWATYRF